MYPLLFSLVYLLYFYSTGINYSYFTPQLLLKSALWITAYWLPIIVYCKWKRKDKLLFFIFVFHILVFLGKPVTLALFPNSQQCTWFYPYRYIYFSIVFILLSIGCWFWIRSRAGWNKKITQILNIACLVLLALMGQRVMAIYPYIVDSHKNHVALNQKSVLPNIYHICLDMHMGQQGLMDGFKYDNSRFYQQLGDLGFWYDLNSKSNYTVTLPSFASMFQMNYLEQVNAQQCVHIIKTQATALDVLRQNGYHLVHYSVHNAFHSDSFDHTHNKHRAYFAYEPIVAQSAVGRLLKHLSCKLHSMACLEGINDACYGKEIYGTKGNYFFIHIVCPHWPYLWTPNSWAEHNKHFDYNIADYENLNSIRTNLITQYKHIDSLALYAIREILNQYDEDHKPIIILHGDHGLDIIPFDITPQALEEKHKLNFSNLYAIYLPKQYRQALPPPPGLANTFRWLFNTLFNTQYPYLESKQMVWHQETSFCDVTEFINREAINTKSAIQQTQEN